MKIIVVNGSSRPRSQSRKISDWVVTNLAAKGETALLLDLHENPLPLDVDLLKFHVEPRAIDAWQPIAEIIDDADAFVIVSPEWNGMAPPALMNFFEYASVAGKPLAHKAVQLITLSSTDGGSYPAAELRVYGPKNNHFCYTPELVIIRNCETVFNSPMAQNGNKADLYLQQRADHSLRVFLEYAKALNTMRNTTQLDLLTYPNGM